MIFFACEKNSSANGNRERQFFFYQSLVQSKTVEILCASSRVRCLQRSHFTVTEQQKNCSFFAVINIFKRSEVRKEVTKGALPKLRGNFK